MEDVQVFPDFSIFFKDILKILSFLTQRLAYRIMHISVFFVCVPFKFEYIVGSSDDFDAAFQLKYIPVLET